MYFMSFYFFLLRKLCVLGHPTVFLERKNFPENNFCYCELFFIIVGYSLFWEKNQIKTLEVLV